MIFITLEFDPKYQVGEKVRLDASKTFKTSDHAAITTVEIDPGDGSGYKSLTGISDASNWYLDWMYSVAGSYTVSVRFNSVDVGTKAIEVLSAASDALFSVDTDLVTLEPDIVKWLPSGRSTWNYVHRKAQDRIMFELNKSKIYNLDGTVLLKTQILDKAEVKEWAIYLALQFIFQGISNSVEDVFFAKSRYYESKANESKEYCFNILRLDLNKDSSISAPGEIESFRSIYITR